MSPRSRQGYEHPGQGHGSIPPPEEFPAFFLKMLDYHQIVSMLKADSFSTGPEGSNPGSSAVAELSCAFPAGPYLFNTAEWLWVAS